MRVLITGASGQIGTALRRHCPDGIDLVLTQRHSTNEPVIQQADLSDIRSVHTLLTEASPDLIINAAAWTDVDGAEEHSEAAAILNTALPAQLANYAVNNAIPLVHYSTDYVYSGKKKQPWTEDDATSPQSVYGKTKLAGDQIIMDSGCACLMLRTSWVYGGPTRNFLSTIADKLLALEPLKVVDDQLGCPTWSQDIARCTWSALLSNTDNADLTRSVQDSFMSGLYHLAGADSGSWYDFAKHIQRSLVAMGKTSVETVDITPCKTSAFPRPAPRPKSSVLNSAAFMNRYNCQPEGWIAVEHCVQQLYG